MKTFETEITVEWGDCDEAGIVFYPNYFYWLDCTFQRLLRSQNLGQRQNRAEFGAVTPLVDVSLQFKAPARYDDTLRIEATIAEWQERRFRIAYRIFSGEKIIAEGYEVRAWATMTDNGLKGAPISEEFRRRLQ
jgi:YbgC/YbaW family acyl-CoA thioester hydrolase